MSDQFAVNEVAVLQNLDDDDAHLNGQDVLVIGGLQSRSGFGIDGTKHSDVLSYMVDIPGEGAWAVTPNHLRKKRPPASDKGERRIMELFVPVEQPDLLPA